MIDRLDQEIITELQKWGRQSYIDLAKLLRCSETTIRNRVKRLLNKGVIMITAIPDPEALGYNFIGIVGLQVKLTDLRTVGQELAKHSNVCYVANVTGRYDFIVFVVARSSREFADFVENIISAIPGILRTETFVSLNIYKGLGIGLDTRQLTGNLEIPPTKR